MIARVYHFIRFVFIFIRALIVSNYQVAKLVLSPTLNIRPGFVAIKLDARTDFEITVLANAITLTPGTISVHITPDHKTIVIHTIDVGDDPESVRRDVIDTLEINILKWTRPAHEVPTVQGGNS